MTRVNSTARPVEEQQSERERERGEQNYSNNVNSRREKIIQHSARHSLCPARKAGSSSSEFDDFILKIEEKRLSHVKSSYCLSRYFILSFCFYLLIAIYLANYLHSRHPAEDVHLVDRKAAAYNRWVTLKSAHSAIEILRQLFVVCQVSEIMFMWVVVYVCVCVGGCWVYFVCVCVCRKGKRERESEKELWVASLSTVWARARERI